MNPPGPADLVILNAHVWTADPALPETQAVSARGGRIDYVGTEDGTGLWIGPRTRVIDAKGRLVLPGFHDDHTHFITGGEKSGGLDLRDAATPDELGRRVAAFARTLPPGAWVTGGDWDNDKWPGGELPTAALLDRHCPDRPVFIGRFDEHMGAANSLALRLAGVTAATEDPVGGTIVRRPGSREPAGVLKDAAGNAVRRVIPPPDPARLADAARRAFREAARFGVTTIHDMLDGEPHLRAYEAARVSGDMTARVYGRWPIAQWEWLADRVRSKGFGDDLFTLRSLKGFYDGSIGSSTALFFAPYADGTPGTGLPGDEADRIPGWAVAADRAGLQISLHAIGDRAIAEGLDLLERLVRENGPRDRRFRIEHDQHPRPEDLPRHAALGAFASAQPAHLADDGRYVEARLGPARDRTAYPFRAFLDAGIRLGFGSDWTVATLDPIAGIDAAVNRRTTGGLHPDGWNPGQKLTVAEAIRAYTTSNAWAAYAEDRTGSITVGKDADLVVLDRDLLRIPPDEIAGTRVDFTILAGRVVHEKT